MKGQVEAGAAVSNNYRLEITGLPAIYFTRVGELARELVIAELADRTNVSTGEVKPGTFEADQYLHHTSERLALEALHGLASGGVLGYKSSALLHHLDAGGNVKGSWLIQGLICTGRKLPELAAGEDGEGVKITWSFAYDDVIPV